MRRVLLAQMCMALLGAAGCARHPATPAGGPEVIGMIPGPDEPPDLPPSAGPSRRLSAEHRPSTHKATTARARVEHHVRRYLVHRGPGRNDWTVACDGNGNGPADCRIEAVIRQDAPTAPAASISSTDGGKTWVVAATPAPGAARLKVGQHAPIEADCSMPGDACAITGEAAARLTHDFESGARLSAQVLTMDGQLQRNVSLQGFSKELSRLRARLPADAGPPQSPATPPPTPATAPVAPPEATAAPQPAPPASAAPAPATN